MFCFVLSAREASVHGRLRHLPCSRAVAPNLVHRGHWHGCMIFDSIKRGRGRSTSLGTHNPSAGCRRGWSPPTTTATSTLCMAVCWCRGNVQNGRGAEEGRGDAGERVASGTNCRLMLLYLRCNYLICITVLVRARSLACQLPPTLPCPRPRQALMGPKARARNLL
jgi:hypothetical protein